MPATGEGFLRLGELCENVLQNGRRLLQHVIVPVTRDPKTFGHQDGFSRHVTPRRCMLTAIDLDDDALFEANEVQNEALKWDLSAKFEEREPSVAKQSHMAASASAGSFFRYSSLVKVRSARAVGRGRVSHEPHPAPSAPPSPTRGEGKISAAACRKLSTPASASARRARLWNPCPAPASASRDRPVAAPPPRPRSGRRYPADSAS